MRTVTDNMPHMVVSNGMVSPLYKRVHELDLHSELIDYNCIVYQQNLIGKALGFKEIMTTVISAADPIGSHWLNHGQFEAFCDKIRSELCAPLKFVGLAYARLCSVFCHY